jgi:hypothetical protein
VRTCDPIGLQKAILWEQAKGLLRAMVAAEGSQPAQYGAGGARVENLRWVEGGKRVEKFIKQFEDCGLQE